MGWLWWSPTLTLSAAALAAKTRGGPELRRILCHVVRRRPSAEPKQDQPPLTTRPMTKGPDSSAAAVRAPEGWNSPPLPQLEVGHDLVVGQGRGQEWKVRAKKAWTPRRDETSE